MSMIIPINKSFLQRLYQFISRLKAAALECQRSKLFPPRLNQIQPTSVLGQEQNLQFGPSRQCQSGLSAFMGRKIVFNNQPTVGRKLADDQFQELNVAGAITTQAHQNRGLSRRRFERSMNLHFPAAAVIRLKSCSPWTQLPFFARISLDGNRAHFINTNDTCSRRRRHISLDYAPPFFPQIPGHVYPLHGTSSAVSSI